MLRRRDRPGMHSDTTAFVTGASGGIGREIAETLAGYGANVAIAARSDGIYETADRIERDAFMDTQAVNVAGPLTCAKFAAPHLRESSRGSVVNIASIGGKRPYPNRTPYAASKMALIGLTRTLAYELGRDDVTVNAVLPGPVEGDRIEAVIEKQAELAALENAEPASIGPNDFALDEFMVPPEDVAEQVAHLAGPDARHVTAQEIGVDSGGTWY